MLRNATYLKDLADSANRREKSIQSIIDFCEAVAGDGNYKTSFNNYELKDGMTPYRLKVALDKFGLITNGLQGYSDADTERRVSFEVIWG